MSFARILVLVNCSVLAASAVCIQVAESDGPSQRPTAAADQTSTRADTPDALYELLQQLITRSQKDDTDGLSTLIHSLIVPDYQRWFVQVFGPETGASMGKLYTESLPDFDSTFEITLKIMDRYLQDSRTALTVARVQSGETIKTMQKLVPIYTVSGGPVTYGKGFLAPGFFVFVEGNFRYVGWHVLGAVRHLMPTRIRVGGNDYQAQLIHPEEPVYPSEANAKNIQGTVLLHVVADYDGAIIELQPVSGPIELRQSALDAVRQWRYRPTIVNDESVQVDTMISVLYSIGEAENRGHAWDTHMFAAQSAYEQGHYPEAEENLKAALSDSAKFPPNDQRIATTLRIWALMYRAQDKNAEAEPLLKRSLAIREKALGPDHPDLATALTDLAKCYLAERKYTEAEPLYKRLLAIAERGLGPDHPDLATSLNNLGMVCLLEDKYAEAEPLLKRSLAIREKALGPDHPDVAASLGNYAALLRATNREMEAEKLEARARAIRAKLGTNSAPQQAR